jgi:hypothetical protein
MKAFEKWYSNSGCAWTFSIEESKTNKRKFEVAWKAALIWVLNHPDSEYISYDLDFVKEELTDET